jgi:hypothetical protein
VDLACTTVDGGTAAVADGEPHVTVPRRFTSAASCAANKAASEIRIVKTAVGGDDVFLRRLAVGLLRDRGGTGTQVFRPAAGRFTVTEVVPGRTSPPSPSILRRHDEASGQGGHHRPRRRRDRDLHVHEYAGARDRAINIVKTTAGGNGSFAFSTLGAGLSSFSLTTTGGFPRSPSPGSSPVPTA